jgi:hypothetical protein
VHLASRIAADLPGLTLHDGHHFNALWDRADQIAGEDFPLTPAEVFVLGGAILLHDAANTVAAYPGGREEVMKTPEWLDAVATIERDGDYSDDDGTNKIDESLILFNTLRTLHARRAEELGELSFENREAGVTVRLIQDDQIRAHLGPLIGLIAASHHWDINALERKLPQLRGALSGHPPTWTIRPLVVACLLRCADACQLDQERAPDFLYALLKLRGVSESHWRAQHRLATPVVDASEPAALVFSSTRPFRDKDADAWWIAYDAIQIAERELRASNNLLRDLRHPPFSVQRIRDSETPDRLARHVEVDGWSPVSAEIRISNVDRVVEMFGGEELYGHAPLVALRELIQNAADAVYLRRELEPADSEYEGRVSIKLSAGTDGCETGYWLQVDDDGLGMSRSVMTGPLIDFGSSYSTSDLAKLERPGLASKSKRRIGKYGIGFFSIFMCSDKVLVSSRPFDDGIKSTKTLIFRKSYALRPILLDERQQDFRSNHSTLISAFLSDTQKNELLAVSEHREDEHFSLKEAVGVICQTLDVDVYVKELNDQKVKVHSRKWYGDKDVWLRRVSHKATVLSHGRTEPYYDLSSHMEFIDPGDTSLGMACINYLDDGYSPGLSSVGGLSANIHNDDDIDSDYVGVIECWPDGPRRDAGDPVHPGKLAAWADRQVMLVKTFAFELSKYEVICHKISNMGGNAEPIAVAFLSGTCVELGEIVDGLAAGNPIDVIISEYAKDDQAVVYIDSIDFTGAYPRRNISHDVECDGLVIYASRSSYSFYTEIAPRDGEQNPISLAGMISDRLRSINLKLHTSDVKQKVVGVYNGVSAERDGLVAGLSIQAKVITFTAVER